jgi:membrane fusion protein, multidrug efflux system
MRVRPRLLLLSSGAALVLLVGALAYWRLTRAEESTDNAHVEMDLVPLAARVSGRVRAVHVADNALVERGQLLIELEPQEQQIRVEQAGAALDAARAEEAIATAQRTIAEADARGGQSSARAHVVTSAAAVRSSDAQLEVARAALTKAEGDVARASREARRSVELLAAGAISVAEGETAQSNLGDAQAALSGVRAQLAAQARLRQQEVSKVDEAQGQLDQRAPVDAKIAAADAELALARARVRAAQATLDEAELRLADTQIRAPLSGRVSRLTAVPGQLFAAGQPLARVVAQQAYVLANFKETQIGEMRSGQRSEIVIDAYPGVSLTGQVESLAGGTGARFSLLPPDHAAGNFVKVVQRISVRISLQPLPPGLTLHAGLSAEVTVMTDSTTSAERAQTAH